VRKAFGGVFILPHTPHTLKDLRDIPDWPALYPEIHAALQELPEKFRKVEIAATENITRLASPRVFLPRAILAPPQILIPAFPDWLHDLIDAQKGDREAANRLCTLIPAPKGMRQDVLAQAVIRVLSLSEFELTVYLENSDPWLDGDGTLKGLIPDEWLPYEVLEWLKIEAVRAMQSGDAYYSPSVILSAVPSEQNPLPLGRPLNQRLIVIDQGGNRFGSGIFGETPEDFLAVLTPVVLGLHHDKKPIRIGPVAEALNIDTDTIKKRRRLMGFKSWAEVVNRIISL
jgi:hypothetical protein